MNELPVPCTGGAKMHPNGGSGGTPRQFFFVTCSEIDSNAIWLKVLLL